jgi:murein L,D-transpeptidase YafK
MKHSTNIFDTNPCFHRVLQQFRETTYSTFSKLGRSARLNPTHYANRVTSEQSERKNRRIYFVVFVLTGLSMFGFRTVEERLVKKRIFRNEPTGTVYLVIDKSDYELKVYDDEGWYATYPVVFGNKNLTDKMQEGDRKTPEGHFKIISKRPHQKWHKMLMLDYPNKESWEKFNERKKRGLIPKTAKIGGGIAIHGTWPNDNIVVDDYTNWTNGCIALKNEDLDELEIYLPVGTQVVVQR